MYHKPGMSYKTSAEASQRKDPWDLQASQFYPNQQIPGQ